MSAWETSLRSICSSFHGCEKSSCEEGEESGRGPLIPFPHVISGVRVLSGSKKDGEGQISESRIKPYHRLRDYLS